MSDTTIIAVYGLPGAGKSTVVDIASRFGLPTVSMGDIVRSRAHDALGDDLSSDAIAQWATDERDKHGDAIIATYTADRIESLGEMHDAIVVDGVRSLAELEEFDQFDTRTIHVSAPFVDRLERLQDRDREDEGSFTVADLADRDRREVQWGFDALIRDHSPDYTIRNADSIDRFRQSAANIIMNIAADVGVFESVEMADPDTTGLTEIGMFAETEPWSIRSTDTIPGDDDPATTYIEVRCPHCGDPNAFETSLTSQASPITCASCDTEFEIHMSITTR